MTQLQNDVKAVREILSVMLPLGDTEGRDRLVRILDRLEKYERKLQEISELSDVTPGCNYSVRLDKILTKTREALVEGNDYT